MDENNLELFKKQHLDNYKKALLEIIQNNTKILIEEDILSLFKKPPLDSMDYLKCKILEIAKRNKIIVDVDCLEKYLDQYRKSFQKSFSLIKKNRVDYFNALVSKNDEIVKINKKDFITVNKEIKKILKDNMIDSFDKYILGKIDSLFQEEIDSEILKNVSSELDVYLKKNYMKQLLHNIEHKLMVKDTIMMNACKEQNERYLFTLNHSRLLNDFNH